MFLFFVAKNYGPFITPVSYSGGAGFETCIGDHLFRIMILVDFLRICRQILGHGPYNLVQILTRSQFMTICFYHSKLQCREFSEYSREKKRERAVIIRYTAKYFLFHNVC